jgi:hypothetical protein
MKTIKAFTEQSNINPKLVRAVIRQVGGFEAFKEIADDVTNYGANAGFSGFIYYADTLKFSKRNRNLILALLADLNVELVDFGCLKDFSAAEIYEALHNSRSDYRPTVYNALAWFALEQVSWDFINIVEG